MSQTQLLGGYEILGPLGEGSMGQVYKARHPETEQIVVVKMIADDLSGHAVERFKREIRASIQLEHPNLISGYTAGQEEDGGWYYVMEFIDGTTVKTELLQGAFDEERSLDICFKVAQALDYAWGFNLVHRDIKPENIMLTREGDVKLCDMGLAKSLDSQTKLTMNGTVIGTPHYMSPEQARGDDLDFRSDIYSLGATLYQMVTTFPPFHGDEPLTVIRNLLTQDPVSPRDHTPHLSDGICYVISKMMARNPNHRYNAYAALISDISHAMMDRKTMAEESGQIRIMSRTDARDQAYRYCHIPNDADYLFGKIALRNKLCDQPQLVVALDAQEEAAQYGAKITLADVLGMLGMLTPGRVAKIARARCQYEIERSREVFIKAALDNNYLTTEQLDACRELAENEERELVPLLCEEGYLDAKQRRFIRCYQRMVRRKEEDQQFVQVAIENQFITQAQAQKCLVIQNNGIVMGAYRDLGGVMVARELMKLSHKQVILRAIRRNVLTGRSIPELILEQRVPEEDSDYPEDSDLGDS